MNDLSGGPSGSKFFPFRVAPCVKGDIFFHVRAIFHQNVSIPQKKWSDHGSIIFACINICFKILLEFVH